MSTPNPLEKAHTAPAPPKISSQQFVIAGILTTVYGLEELSPSRRKISCLWLLHPRLASQQHMTPLASAIVAQWNRRLREQEEEPGKEHAAQGLIAVSFDQRNHGSREIDPRANRAWREGGETHAQDMFSTIHGTALDTSQLITYLSAYVFPSSAALQQQQHQHTLTQHLALGVSLGGHCVWHCLLQDPRITTGIVVIGCPDYVGLMTDRARLSKRKSYWTEMEKGEDSTSSPSSSSSASSSPPGSRFLGSVDFPPGLVEAVAKYDPVGLFWGTTPEARAKHTPNQTQTQTQTQPYDKEHDRRTASLLHATLAGKRILNLAGGADKLVPYAHSAPFLQWLKGAVSPSGGVFADGEAVLQDRVFEGVGHAMSEGMEAEAIRFVNAALEEERGKEEERKGEGEGSVDRGSKM